MTNSVWMPLYFSVFVALLGALFIGCSEPPPEVSADPDAGPDDAGLACEDYETECNDQCVDQQTDSDHCGECDHSCGDNRQCTDGQCIADCPDGQELCDDECVDTEADGDHCGGCNSECHPDQSCSGGDCTCSEDMDFCDGECVPILTSSEHCGSCSNACDSDQYCEDGSCVDQCDDNLEPCNSSCVDLQTDLDHCGSCDNNCSTSIDGASVECETGQCQPYCDEGGAEMCTDEQVCADLMTSVEHCGDCGNECEAIEGAQPDCAGGDCEYSCDDDEHTICFDDGICTDLSTDIEHCGECGAACDDDPNGTVSCEDGDCTIECDDGYDECGGSCVDLDTDSDHCGSCDNACDSGDSCLVGNCDPCDPTGFTFGGGDGTADDPYLICSESHFQNIQFNLDDNFEIRTDIGLTTTSMFEGGFEGTLDGGGHTVTGLDLYINDGLFAALFDVIESDGLVTNLALSDITIDGTLNDTNTGQVDPDGVGTLAGISRGTIEDVTVDGQVLVTYDPNVAGGYYLGGLVGQLDSNATVERVAVDVAVTTEGYSFVGGLAGYVSSGGSEIIESGVSGDVSASENTDAGGLVGRQTGELDVYDSYTSGDVSTDGDGAGFIANTGASDTFIDYSYSYGEIDANLSEYAFSDSRNSAYLYQVFWNSDVNSSDGQFNSEPLSEDEFSDQTEFDEWDFDDIWELSSDSGRPVLQWESE